jgi:hypothetical protein
MFLLASHFLPWANMPQYCIFIFKFSVCISILKSPINSTARELSRGAVTVDSGLSDWEPIRGDLLGLSAEGITYVWRGHVGGEWLLPTGRRIETRLSDSEVCPCVTPYMANQTVIRLRFAQARCTPLAAFNGEWSRRSFVVKVRK